MKERGILPQRPWTERPVYISSTGTVFEPYVPPEGDGKVSSITKQVISLILLSRRSELLRLCELSIHK